MEYPFPDDSFIMSENDSLHKCNFPTVPRLSPPVKSLLEISESMDVTILHSKLSATKASNHFGPWTPDDKWSQRKQRTSRNYRKHVARLLMTKKNPSSVEFPRSSSLRNDDSFIEKGKNVESSRDAMDPYFKKRPSGPQLRYTTSKSSNIIPDVMPTYHQTPSLPTLITLQSPTNKNFHSAFSLGRVNYDSEMTPSSGVPLLLYSKTGGSRETKSAAENPANLEDVDQTSAKITEFRSKTSTGMRPSENCPQYNIKEKLTEKIGKRDDEMLISEQDNKETLTKSASSNVSRNFAVNSGCTDNKLPSNGATNRNFIVAAKDRGGILCDDRFDMITSPPENPKILKILSQRKPSPPMCEFEDISLHIRHYRMYHTMRFTGRFSLANQPPPQDVKPVQWSEVFPHRPLSVNSTTTVPVFRLKVQDFSSDKQTTNNNNGSQTPGEADMETATLPHIATTKVTINSDKNKLEVPKAEDEKPEPDAEVGEEYKSYRRRSIPNYKDRTATIDLTPTVTPVLKYKVKRENGEGDDHDDIIQEERDSSTEMVDKNMSEFEKDLGSKDRPQKHNKESWKNRFNPNISSNNEKKSTIKLPNLKEDVKIIGNLNLRSTEEDKDENIESDSIKEPSQGSLFGSKKTGDGARNTTKVLFSYREFLKRSATNIAAAREGLYTPRLRDDRESILERRRSNEGDWKYPYSRKHSFISILHSDRKMPNQNSRNIVIDEDQLKMSIEEKIHESTLRFIPKRRTQGDGSDKFIQFMVKHDEGQNSQGPISSEVVNSELPCDSIKNLGTNPEEEGTDARRSRMGIVSTYDVSNTYESDAEENMYVKENGDTSNEPLDHPNSRDNADSTVSSSNKKFWCPKNSRLSAKTRKINQNTEIMRQLVSAAPFQNKPLSSVNNSNSAFVIAVPPPRKGFDDRSVVLPLQDFVQMAMKGTDQTFSKVSKSINSGCKLGISQNMTIRSASSRRAMDDGLVRVVSFASPVNQFIFAKRITGYSAASRRVATPDGSFTDTEQKARSLFQGRTSGGFRLRLRDFGVKPSRTGDSQNARELANNENQGTKQFNILDKIVDPDYGHDDKGGRREAISNEGMDCTGKKFVDIYIPNEGDESLSVTNMNFTNGADFVEHNSPQTAQNYDKTLAWTEQNSLDLTLTHHQDFRADTDTSMNEKERERSALRKHIVKLAEMRTSSGGSDHDTMQQPNICDGHATSLSTSFDTAQKAGTHGFKLIHSGACAGNWPCNSSGESDVINDRLSSLYSSRITDVTSKDDQGELNSLNSLASDLLSQEAYGHEKLPQQKSRFHLRQKAKSKARKKVLKPNAIIRKDIKVESTYSIESMKQFVSATESKEHTNTLTTVDTKGLLVPEGNPMMYSRIVRGSCLKKEAPTEDEVQRPKTVRFKCDGVEYKIVERIHDKK